MQVVCGESRQRAAISQSAVTYRKANLPSTCMEKIMSVRNLDLHLSLSFPCLQLLGHITLVGVIHVMSSSHLVTTTRKAIIVDRQAR